MTSSTKRILIGGIGNVFLGDDGFGVEVVRRLAGRSLPEGVVVVEFGVRGFDLAYALLDGYDAAILVDAARRGQVPGTLYVIEPDPEDAAGPGPSGQPDGVVVDAHSLDPMRVLRLVSAMGARPPLLLVVGCEPVALCFDDLGLSAPVALAAGEAVGLIESLVGKIVRGEPIEERSAPSILDTPVERS